MTTDDIGLATGNQMRPMASAPLLYEGESAEEYWAFYKGIEDAVHPRDNIEALLLDDAIVFEWEKRRLRMLKKRLIESSQYNGLWRLLDKMIPNHQERCDLLSLWVRGDRDARYAVTSLMNSAGLSSLDVEAHTVAALMKHIDAFDRQIMRLSHRFDALLHGIDRRRLDFAVRVRRTLKDAEDAFVVTDALPPPEPSA